MAKKILVIEDDPYVQRMYKKMFGFQNYDLDLAANGTQGLAFAKANKPDLILLDIILPDMNGLEVLERLKAEGDTKHIPVLMLTNLADEATMENAKNLGAETYMIKADFSPHQVLSEVEKHLADKN